MAKKIGGSGYAALSYDIIKNCNPYKVPVIKANEGNISRFGELLYNMDDVYNKYKCETWPKMDGFRNISEGTGNEAPIITGEFNHWYKQDMESEFDNHYVCYAQNNAVQREYKTCYRIDNKLFCRELNYHPCGNQLLFPITVGVPYVVLLGRVKPTYDSPDYIELDDFVAFIIDGHIGLNIHANTWHQPSFPLNINDNVIHFNGQSSIHACVVYDSIDESNTILEMEL